MFNKSTSKLIWKEIELLFLKENEFLKNFTKEMLDKSP